jgi:hypothetical protein
VEHSRSLSKHEEGGIKRKEQSQPPGAQAYNTSYVGGYYQENCGSKSAWAKYFMRPPISLITRAKWTGGVAQAVELLLYQCEALSSNSSPTRKGGREEGREEGREGGKEGGTILCQIFTLRVKSRLEGSIWVL